jgi:hypothetical protein
VKVLGLAGILLVIAGEYGAAVHATVMVVTSADYFFPNN